METYTSREDYSRDLFRDVRRTLIENFQDIGFKGKNEFEHKIDHYFRGKVQTNPDFFSHLCSPLCLNSEVLELIIRVCEKVSFKKYLETVK